MTKQPLVPVGRLKPLSWFCLGGAVCLKIDAAFYAYLNTVGVPTTSSYGIEWMVEPLPDCKGFDYRRPKEPMAMELAKERLSALVGANVYCAYSRGQVIDWLEGIIAAMEREAKK